MKHWGILCVVVASTATANFNPNKRHLVKDMPMPTKTPTTRPDDTSAGNDRVLDDLVLNAEGRLDGLVVNVADTFHAEDCEDIIKQIKVKDSRL